MRKGLHKKRGSSQLGEGGRIRSSWRGLLVGAGEYREGGLMYKRRRTVRSKKRMKLNGFPTVAGGLRGSVSGRAAHTGEKGKGVMEWDGEEKKELDDRRA